MTKIMLVAALVANAGCDMRAKQTESIIYTRDSRTGLCFASPMERPSFTHVPCTPWVKMLVACAKNFGERADRCQGPATVEDAPPADAGE